MRIAGGTRRRLNIFAVTQIGASFVLIAGAVMLLRTFLALQAASPGFDTSRVLAVNVPVTSYGRTPEQTRDFYRQLQERVGALPGVERWRSAARCRGATADSSSAAASRFQVEGGTRGDASDDPRAKIAIGVARLFRRARRADCVAGRDFNADDRDDARAGRHRQPRASRRACSPAATCSTARCSGPIRS